jgi:hypothetical protein
MSDDSGNEDFRDEMPRYLFEERHARYIDKMAEGGGHLDTREFYLSQPGVVGMMVERDPASIRRRDRLGRLLIHEMIACHSDVREVKYLLMQWPEAVYERGDDKYGCLPIHVACQHCCQSYDDDNADASSRINTVRLLVRAWPESVQERTADGRLPLECALARLDLVKFLVEAWPDAIAESFMNGAFLFHEAVNMLGPPEENLKVVQYLVERRPHARSCWCESNPPAAPRSLMRVHASFRALYESISQ